MCTRFNSTVQLINELNSFPHLLLLVSVIRFDRGERKCIQFNFIGKYHFHRPLRIWRLCVCISFGILAKREIKTQLKMNVWPQIRKKNIREIKL